MEETSKKSVLPGDAVQVLILTALAYLVAYAYEVSYLKTFGVPADFATINVKTIVVSGFAVFAIFAIIYQVLDIIATLIQEKAPNGNLSKLFGQFGILLIPLVIIVLFSDLSYLNKLYLILVPFSTFWFQVIFPIFERKHYGSYKKAQTAIIESSNSRPSGILANNASKNTGKYALIILVSIYSIMAASAVGSMTALEQEEFLIDEKAQLLLIRAYGDKAIFGKLNDDVLSETYSIKKLEGITLSRKNLSCVKNNCFTEFNLANYIKSLYSSFRVENSDK